MLLRLGKQSPFVTYGSLLFSERLEPERSVTNWDVVMAFLPQSVEMLRGASCLRLRTVATRRMKWREGRGVLSGRTTKKAWVALRQLVGPRSPHGVRTLELAPAAPMEIRITGDSGSQNGADSQRPEIVVLQQWVKGTRPGRRDGLDIIKELESRSDQRELYYQVFHWLLEQPWFEPSARDHTKLVDRCGKDHQIHDAELAFQRMQDAGFPVDLFAMTVLMNAYARAGQMEKVAECMDRLALLGLSPDDRTYTSLIVAHGLAGSPEAAERVLDDMVTGGMTPSLQAYTAGLVGYSRLGLVEGSLRIFRSMQDKGHAPDVKAYTALMRAYGRAGDPARASQVLQSMRGVGVRPDEGALTAVVEAYGAQGMLREALEFVMQAEGHGYRPGTETLTALIGALARAGLASEAAQVFEHMQEGAVPRKAKTFAFLFHAFARARQAETAECFLQMAAVEGHSMDSYLYNLMLEGLVEGGLYKEAETMVERIQREGFDPSLPLSSALLAGTRSGVVSH